MPLQPPSKTIVVQNAAVCPPGEQKIVCQDVNFTLTGGKALGIIGPSFASVPTPRPTSAPDKSYYLVRVAMTPEEVARR